MVKGFILMRLVQWGGDKVEFRSTFGLWRGLFVDTSSLRKPDSLWKGMESTNHLN